MLSVDKVNELVSIDALLAKLRMPKNKQGFICCPFHAEKSASLKVYGKEGRQVSWICFGCHAKGKGAVEFYAKLKNINKVKAAQIVARAFKIDPKIVVVNKPDVWYNREVTYKGWEDTTLVQIRKLLWGELPTFTRQRLYGAWMNYGIPELDRGREEFIQTGDIEVLFKVNRRVLEYLDFVREVVSWT